MHEPQYMRPCSLLCIAARASRQPQCMIWNVVQLVDCSSAAKGDDEPQLERFYTVPIKSTNLCFTFF